MRMDSGVEEAAKIPYTYSKKSSGKAREKSR
jgi:hypothetical protein